MTRVRVSWTEIIEQTAIFDLPAGKTVEQMDATGELGEYLAELPPGSNVKSVRLEVTDRFIESVAPVDG